MSLTPPGSRLVESPRVGEEDLPHGGRGVPPRTRLSSVVTILARFDGMFTRLVDESSTYTPAATGSRPKSARMKGVTVEVGSPRRRSSDRARPRRCASLEHVQAEAQFRHQPRTANTRCRSRGAILSAYPFTDPRCRARFPVRFRCTFNSPRNCRWRWKAVQNASGQDEAVLPDYATCTGSPRLKHHVSIGGTSADRNRFAMPRTSQ